MLKLKQHPDLGGDQWNAMILNEAYEILSDDKKRKEYDKRLFVSYTKKPFSQKKIKKKPFISIFCPFCKRPLARKSRPGESCPTCRSPLQSGYDEETLHQDYHRSVERIKKTGRLRYYNTWPQRGYDAKILDLSPKGIRFLCNERLRKELIIKLSSPLLKAIAQVIYIQKKELNGKIIYTVGAQFMTVTFTKQKGSFFSTIV
jgi:curved DNA-binding protein CbpA